MSQFSEFVVSSLFILMSCLQCFVSDVNNELQKVKFIFFPFLFFATGCSLVIKIFS